MKGLKRVMLELLSGQETVHSSSALPGEIFSFYTVITYTAKLVLQKTNLSCHILSVSLTPMDSLYIPFASLGQLPWPCPPQAPCAAPHWQRVRH